VRKRKAKEVLPMGLALGESGGKTSVATLGGTATDILEGIEFLSFLRVGRDMNGPVELKEGTPTLSRKKGQLGEFLTIYGSNRKTDKKGPRGNETIVLFAE